MECGSAVGLEDKINDSIWAGYKPIGGITFSNGYAYQAIIKEEEQKIAVTQKKEEVCTVTPPPTTPLSNDSYVRLTKYTNKKGK